MSHRRSPASITLAASRSLLHGTDGLRPHAAVPRRSPSRAARSRGSGRGGAARAPSTSERYCGCSAQHVEVVDERAARSAAAAARRRCASLFAGSSTSSFDQVVPSMKRTTSTLTSGAKAITSGAAPDSAAAARVGVLVVAVDRQQRALGGREAGDVHALGGGDLEVAVGETAREVADALCTMRARAPRRTRSSRRDRSQRRPRRASPRPSSRPRDPWRPGRSAAAHVRAGRRAPGPMGSERRPVRGRWGRVSV